MRRRTLLALMMAGVLLLAACSDGDDEPGPAAGGATDQATEEPTDEPAASGASVAVADSDLGEILVDGDGMTLYVFFADKGSKSTCYDDCEEAWPPLTVDGEPVAGDGVDQSLLGTTERDDGSTQVTYDDQPLYLFASDGAPGDTKGQGVGDVWFVVGPDGSPIEDAQAVVDSGGAGGAGYGADGK
jgi:predicted lipoprotein with Yx(FWY)xxD motif